MAAPGRATSAPGVVDMERIDPDKVKLPGWYKPNPGRARDLAFILFTGSGERTRPNRITNRRWILSAFGTAASASLSEADTVYSVTPVYHPSGLMVSFGGAIAGGARIAMARDFDPATFWDEVRRYGVTVGTYTWTMLRDLVEAPPNPNERHHPVRLFMGSGMPKGLWARVVERFAPARIVEFYASTQGEVVLANVSGQKVGAMGRPLPGSARVRIAALDLEDGKLSSTDDGFARECDDERDRRARLRGRPGREPDGRDTASRRLSPRRRVGRDRRPLSPRRRRRLLAPRLDHDPDPHQGRADRPHPGPRRAVVDPRGGPRRLLRRARSRRRRPSWSSAP